MSTLVVFQLYHVMITSH